MEHVGYFCVFHCLTLYTISTVFETTAAFSVFSTAAMPDNQVIIQDYTTTSLAVVWRHIMDNTFYILYVFLDGEARPTAPTQIIPVVNVRPDRLFFYTFEGLEPGRLYVIDVGFGSEFISTQGRTSKLDWTQNTLMF